MDSNHEESSSSAISKLLILRSTTSQESHVTGCIRTASVRCATAPTPPLDGVSALPASWYKGCRRALLVLSRSGAVCSANNDRAPSSGRRANERHAPTFRYIRTHQAERTEGRSGPPRMVSLSVRGVCLSELLLPTGLGLRQKHRHVFTAERAGYSEFACRSRSYP